jgi:alpha-beta hydrolase superfamily lysophospholipase
VCKPWDFGTGVQGYRWRAPAPRAVLLLQHGFGVHTALYLQLYNALIPHLLAAGVSVAAFDLWGHGRSPGRRAVTDIRASVQDHLAARRALAASGLPIHVMGHSLGGLITASSVALDPKGVAGAIIMSAPMPTDPGLVGRLVIGTLAALAPGARAPLPAAPPSTLSRLPALIEQLVADPLVYRGWATTNLVAATALDVGRHNWPLFRHWTVPTLVVHGSADASIPLNDSRRFFDAISATDKTLNVVDAGRHELLNDSDRDSVLQTLLQWLDRRLTPVLPAADAASSRLHA